jgi:hypothetical protein
LTSRALMHQLKMSRAPGAETALAASNVAGLQS